MCVIILTLHYFEFPSLRCYIVVSDPIWSIQPSFKMSLVPLYIKNV